MGLKKVLGDAVQAAATATIAGAMTSAAPDIYRGAKRGVQALWQRVQEKREEQRQAAERLKAEVERKRRGLPPHED